MSFHMSIAIRLETWSEAIFYVFMLQINKLFTCIWKWNEKLLYSKSSTVSVTCLNTLWQVAITCSMPFLWQQDTNLWGPDCGNKIISCGNQIATCGNKIVSCYHKIEKKTLYVCSVFVSDDELLIESQKTVLFLQLSLFTSKNYIKYIVKASKII